MGNGGLRNIDVKVGGARILHAEIVGSGDAPPVLYFHGAGDSRLARPPRAGLIEELGICLVCLDRPGYGRSDRDPGRTLGGWAADVAAVADALELDSFHVLGWSAGGPHALACAARLPARVRSCGIYGPVAPPDMPGFEEGLDEMAMRCAVAAREQPEQLRDLFAALTADPVAFNADLIRSEPGGAELLGDPAIAALVEANARAAFAQGSDAAVDDFVLIYSPWDFPFAGVQCPTVLRTGTRDRFTPPAWGEWLAGQLPSATWSPVEDANHAGFLVEEIFAELVSATLTAVEGP